MQQYPGPTYRTCSCGRHVCADCCCEWLRVTNTLSCMPMLLWGAVPHIQQRSAGLQSGPEAYLGPPQCVQRMQPSGYGC